MDITIIIAKLKEEMKELFTLKTDTPTKVSDLINDLNFIMQSEVRNNLTSTDTNLPLSANQGRLLNNKVNTKSNSNHTHANISDSGWQNVIFKSGFSNYSNTNPMRYRRIGKIVHLEGIIKNTTAFTPNTGTTIIATIDDPYCRPTYSQYTLMQGTDANKFLLIINSDGTIGISRYGTTAASTQVTANSWLHTNTTWMVETENISIETSIMESEDGLNYFLNAYYSSNTSSDSGDSGDIDDIIDDSGGAIDDEQHWMDDPNSNEDDNNETPYETFYPYAIQLKSIANNGGINNKNIQWRIDNTQQTSSVTENNGYAFFKIPYTTWSNKGNHTFTFNFEEDQTYRASSMSTTISYESVTIPTMIGGNLNGYTFSGTLYTMKTVNEYTTTLEPLSNKTIKCYVNNSLKSTTTTNENGMFSMSIGNPSNSVSVKIYFEGDMPYREATYNTTYDVISIH